KGDTFHVLDALARFGYDPWFRLGDRDLATCVTRSDLLHRGLPLSQATAEIARALGVPAHLLPATDDPLRTKIRTDDGLLDFQEFFVKRRTEGRTLEITFAGAENARPAPGVLDAIREAKAVLLTPSNPLVSIGPILAVPGLRDALRDTPARVAAVSPIVGGRALKGPADRMLRDQAHEATALGVARLYQDFLNVMVIDEADATLKPQIEALGLDVAVTDTIMASMDRKVALARAVLNAVDRSP
ncbi:MAG TPA: 2-phospho-L-lactate transferase CofD family protein, partial [Dehalococcoidia bacterium]|nr:2-phospho-L-lactate transferase CofD family protein [Dehalococcoidia bacterium]